MVEAAERARAVLGRALRRLGEVERRYGPEERLRAEAAAVVRRIGWRAVAQLVPGPAYQALRVAVSLVKVPGRVVDRGLER